MLNGYLAILILRLYALYDCNKRLLTVLLVLYVAPRIHYHAELRIILTFLQDMHCR
jgi:hypothetical protein